MPHARSDVCEPSGLMRHRQERSGQTQVAEATVKEQVQVFAGIRCNSRGQGALQTVPQWDMPAIWHQSPPPVWGIRRAG